MQSVTTSVKNTWNPAGRSEFLTYDEAYAHLCDYLVNNLGYWRTGTGHDAPVVNSFGHCIEFGDTYLLMGDQELLSILPTQWGTHTIIRTAITS